MSHGMHEARENFQNNRRTIEHNYLRTLWLCTQVKIMLVMLPVEE